MRLAAALLILSAACAHTGAYVWVDDYAQKAAPAAAPASALAPGDLVTVRVLGHDEMSTRAKVRGDGRIALPYLDDVAVAGKAPAEVAATLRERFTPFLAHPVVTVTLEEPRPFTVPVTGQVTRPGVYPLDLPAGVLQALASAGGLGQFADEDQIYVLRRSPAGAPVRIRFRYESLVHAEGQGSSFSLQRDDQIVVE